MIRIKNSQQIGQLIKLSRKEQGIDQVSLASICGFSERPLKAIEKGKGTLSVDKLLKILDELGIKLHIEPPNSLSTEDLENKLTQSIKRASGSQQ
jgi:HTH-type transcriptional regulator/antitoxin HipB